MQKTARKYSLHGQSRTPLYRLWLSMRSRCRNPRHPTYPYYGGRGIRVCRRWAKFVNFAEDMAPRPDGLELERIDNNGNYTPKNCRWATHREQMNNTRVNRIVEWRGQRLNVTQWAHRLGLTQTQLESRVRRGKMTIEQALTRGFRERKLSASDVRKIRAHGRTGNLYQREIANLFGISQSEVSLILLGKHH